MILFSYVYDKFTKEYYSNKQYEKTIYLVWRNKKEKTNHGFGDKLRGALFLYQYCNNNKINFELDATDDICGDFLKNVFSNDYDKIKDKPLTYFLYDDKSFDNMVDKIEEKLSTNNDIFVYTHAVPYDLSDDDKQFAKHICESTDEIKLEMNEKIKKLPTDFGIKHFRFEDKVFKNDIDSNDETFKEFYELLKSDYKQTDILFTNSNNFKKYAKENLGIQTIDCDDGLCKIEHIGESTDKDSVKNSFIEFSIISKASYIKSYSTYNWLSNFVKWPANIYNIPVENKRIDEKTVPTL